MKRISNIVTWGLIMGILILLAHTFWINVENARRIDEIKREIQTSEAKYTPSEKRVIFRIKEILE
jgi:hypothetical protein